MITDPEILIKKAADARLTNCVLSPAKLGDRIRVGKIAIIQDNPIVLIDEYDHYQLLYYFFRDISEFSRISDEAVKNLERYDALYADMTVRGDLPDGVENLFGEFGLSLYRIYERKSVVNDGLRYKKMLSGEYASPDDIEVIFELLYNQFEEMCDHLPDRKELERFIDDRKAVVIRIKGSIAGVMLFEDQGKKSYARTLCVADEYRNSFVGYSLFADYIDRHKPDKTRLFYLWVDTGNDAVRGLHDAFGYRADGLKNYIFK